MSARYPIPKEAFDDRLGWVGTSGTGKTYDSGTAIERVLKLSSRVCVVDPLGVWWGLRLHADGKAVGFNVAIFGGPHGDIGITEASGKLIGETVASAKESCIIDLSEFESDASQRRFMLAFLVALYNNLKGNLLHLVFDEADMWAPQRIMDKEGDATKLHHNVQKIVRRGRVKGFIPWLITQRPAEISKSILSMMDGLVMHQALSPQDIGAVMDWVRPRADKATAEDIETRMPAFERGEAVVYIPRRRVLNIAQFPEKATYDSSRAPERGEKKNRPDIELKPLDIDALKKRLEKVDAEAKANDPAKLKAEIAALRRERSDAAKMIEKGMKAAPDRGAIEKAENRGADRAARENAATINALKKALGTAMDIIVKINAAGFFKPGSEAIDKDALESAITSAVEQAAMAIKGQLDQRNRQVDALRKETDRVIGLLQSLLESDVTVQVDVQHNKPFTTAVRTAPARTTIPPKPRAESSSDGALSTPEQRILNALATWRAMGHEQPNNAQVAWLANYSPTSTSYTNPRGALKTKGLVLYPDRDCVALTEDGAAVASPMQINGGLLDHVLGQLPSPERRILEAVASSWPEAVSNAEAAERASYSPTSTSYTNPRGALKTKALVTYPGRDQVRAANWLFS
jgi:hypothetical protein